MAKKPKKAPLSGYTQRALHQRLEEVLEDVEQIGDSNIVRYLDGHSDASVAKEFTDLDGIEASTSQVSSYRYKYFGRFHKADVTHLPVPDDSSDAEIVALRNELSVVKKVVKDSVEAYATLNNQYQSLLAQFQSLLSQVQKLFSRTDRQGTHILSCESAIRHIQEVLDIKTKPDIDIPEIDAAE